MKSICTNCRCEFEKIDRSKQCSEQCRLLSRIKIENGCWIYTGPTNWHGYGKTTFKGKTERVHRISYLIFKGPLKKGKIVCHSCDNKLCINPEHLWLGTYKENMQDALKKGRMKKPFLGKKHTQETLTLMQKNRRKPDKRGEKHHRNKLKNEDVFEIRKMLQDGFTQSEIADKYKVDSSTISNIKSGKRWSHI